MAVSTGYKQTVLGVLPNDWGVTSVGNSFEVLNHLRLPISQSEREKIIGPYPYFGPTSIQGWINDYRIEGQHALIGEDGDHFLKWSSHPMTLLVDGKFNVNNHAHVVKGVANETSWFYWYFLHRDLTAFLTRQGASRYKLTKAVLLDLPCAIPPRKEQQAIANVLSDIDVLIAGLEKLIAKKRDLKQAAMQQLLTGQTRLPGFSGEWEEKELGEIALIVKGQQLPSSKSSPDDHIPHYNGGMQPSSFTYQFNTPANTIAISEGGNSCGFVQFITVPFWCGGHCYAITPKSVDNGFLFQLLKAKQNAIMGLRVGSGLPNVQRTALGLFKVKFPKSTSEQTAIASALVAIDSELISLESRLSKTRELKQGMMQELLTGRTRLI